MVKNTMLALGWIVALGLGATLYVEWQTIHQLDAKLQTTQEVLADAKAQAAELIDLEGRYAALESTVAHLKETAETANESASTLREEFPVPETVNPTALLKKMLGTDGDDEGADKEKNSNPMAAMFAGEAGEQMMRAGAKTALATQYHDLFTTLDLPEERADALREVLQAHLEDQAMAGLALMRGEPIEESTAHQAEDLKNAVAEVLTPEEMARFEQYQDEMPGRLMRQQFDLQIGMLAPGMEAETRQYTVDVLVDHMLADNGDDFDTTSMMPDLSAIRARYEAAATQLESELAPEDMAQVQGFLDQLNLGLDMAASMMGQDDSEPAEKEKTE